MDDEPAFAALGPLLLLFTRFWFPVSEGSLEEEKQFPMVSEGKQQNKWGDDP